MPKLKSFTKYRIVSPLDGSKKTIQDKDIAIEAFKKGAIVIENFITIVQLSTFSSTTTIHSNQWTEENFNDRL
jgi:hypothetical protein